MKKVLLAFAFLLLGVAGMSQNGSYRVDKIYNSNVQPDDLYTDVVVMLYKIDAKQMDLNSIVINDGKLTMMIDRASNSESFELSFQISLQRQEGNSRVYAEGLTIEQLKSGKYLIKDKNNKPLIEMTKQE